MVALPSDIFSLLVAATLVAVLYYLWSFTQWHYWKVRGVPYLKPVLPLVGSLHDILRRKGLPDIVNRMYKEAKDLPYVGIYAFHSPALFVKDLDLVAHILIKDFDHFEDRGFHFNKSDTLGRNLIHQTGPDWKFSRTKLAPCFNITKAKAMLSIMKNKSDVLVERLEKEATVNAWDVMLRYTTDVITTCTYGVESDSLQKNEEQFIEAGKELLGIHFIYHVFIGTFFPIIHKLLRLSVANAKVTSFFQNVIKQVVTYRKENKGEKKDFVNVLLQLKEDSDSTVADKKIPEIDDNFIAAQAFIFFLAGFETPGNILATSLYEIVKSPQLQAALYAEITNVLNKYNGEATFEALQEMKFLRQVVSEVLRRYTPLDLIFRRCTKDYIIPGTSTVIQKGTLIVVPVRNIHRDPNHYPNPDVFDPERFSEENSSSRHIAAYMPFGIGPRICPAILYSHIKIRTALVYILRRFEVCPTKETPCSLEASPVDFLFAPKDGIPLLFKKRES